MASGSGIHKTNDVASGAAHGRFSNVGQKLTTRTGILKLMDDLGNALIAQPNMLMLGGGNPAAVPEIQTIWRNRMAQLLAQPDTFDRMLSAYDPPQGNPRFLRAFAEMLHNRLGWPVTSDHVAITNGTQSTFFFLFAALAGMRSDGSRRKILLPLTPEYIGYADQGLEHDVFISCKPTISWPGGPNARVFKYQIDFAAVEACLKAGDIAAMALSRPCNPTGNVVTDADLRRLESLAARYGVYLIIDGAYGVPFPGVVFADTQPVWSPHAIHTFSLSKLGLPGARTGIIVAPPEIIEAIAAMTAIAGLSNGTIGQQIVLPLVESGEILELGPKILRPFYERRANAAQQAVRDFFGDTKVNWAMHASEGAFFLWLWFRGLPVTTQQLYERLKHREVLVVPGEFFFFGLRELWEHRHECLRINFAQSPEIVREGIRRIADEVRSCS
jgi:valine--pyruvate aminotransferase